MDTFFESGKDLDFWDCIGRKKLRLTVLVAAPVDISESETHL